MNEQRITFIVLVVCTLTLFYAIIILNMDEKACSMRFNENVRAINGLAVGDEYYCVWTKNKMIFEVASTDEHEKCHVLVAKDHDHFCGEVL